MKPQVFTIKVFYCYSNNREFTQVQSKMYAYTCNHLQHTKMAGLDIVHLHYANGLDEDIVLGVAREADIKTILDESNKPLARFSWLFDKYRESQAMISKIVVENPDGKNTQIIRLDNVEKLSDDLEITFDPSDTEPAKTRQLIETESLSSRHKQPLLSDDERSGLEKEIIRMNAEKRNE